MGRGWVVTPGISRTTQWGEFQLNSTPSPSTHWPGYRGFLLMPASGPSPPSLCPSQLPANRCNGFPASDALLLYIFSFQWPKVMFMSNDVSSESYVGRTCLQLFLYQSYALPNIPVATSVSLPKGVPEHLCLAWCRGFFVVAWALGASLLFSVIWMLASPNKSDYKKWRRTE